MQELLWTLEGGKLVKVLKKLKEQERQILLVGFLESRALRILDRNLT